VIQAESNVAQMIICHKNRSLQRFSDASDTTTDQQRDAQLQLRRQKKENVKKKIDLC
jgi:hypothetical protein